MHETLSIEGIARHRRSWRRRPRRSSVTFPDTHVTFKEYGEEEISAYLDTDEAYDKAGGYAIQGTFAKYIESVDGDVDNVIGFPLTRFLKEMEKFIK